MVAVTQNLATPASAPIDMKTAAFWSDNYLFLDFTKAHVNGDKNSCEVKCLLSNPNLHIQYTGDSAPSKNVPNVLIAFVDKFQPLPESSDCQNICTSDIYSSLMNVAALQLPPQAWKNIEFKSAEKNPSRTLTIEQTKATFSFNGKVFTFDQSAMAGIKI